MPAQNRIRGHDGGDFEQGLSPKGFTLHGEPSPLVVVEQDPALAKLLPEYTILGLKILDDFLLFTINPTGECQNRQMPRSENQFHTFFHYNIQEKWGIIQEGESVIDRSKKWIRIGRTCPFSGPKHFG